MFAVTIVPIKQLRETPFRLPSPGAHFTRESRPPFHFQGGNATLFVCQDSAKRELDACFRVNGETGLDEWRHDFMEVLPSDTKFYIIAKIADGHMSKVYIDNLRLTDLQDNPVC